MSDNNLPGLGRATDHLSSSGVEELLTELLDNSPDQRVAAARRLGELGGSQAITALLGRFTNDISPDVRLAAVDALAQIGDSAAWPVLGSIFGEHQLPNPEASAWSESTSFEENTYVRKKVVEVLGDSKWPEVGKTLCCALTDKEPEVRQVAIQYLSEIKVDQEIIDSLIQGLSVLKNDTIYQFGTGECLKILKRLGPNVINSLLKSIRNLDIWVGDVIEETFFDFDNDEVVNSISFEYPFDSFIADRIEILASFGANLFPELSKYDWQNITPLESIVVVRASANIISGKTVELLCKLAIHDSTEEVRWFAIDSLGRYPGLSNEHLTNTLVQILSQDPVLVNRIRAVHAIGERHELSALPQLCEISRMDKENILRECAIAALGEMADPRAITTLGSILLESSETDERKLAAEALGKIKSPGTFSYLRTASFNDREPSVRLECVNSMNLNDPNVLTCLKSLENNDRNKVVRDRVKQRLDERK